MNLTAEEINRYIDKFTPIYKDGKEINPMPENTRITVWCESNDDSGFACNTLIQEMGLNAFIAKSWILETELQKLYNES